MSSGIAMFAHSPLEEFRSLVGTLCNSLSARCQEKLRQLWLEDLLATDIHIDSVLHDLGDSNNHHEYSELRSFTLAKLGN